jgi:hypothetical protein
MEVKLSSASTISEADLATAVPETNHRLNGQDAEVDSAIKG